MNKSHSHELLLLIFVTLISIMVNGCPMSSAAMSESKGTIKITLTSGAARTLIPPSTDLNVATYDLSGTGPAQTAFSATDVTASYTAANLLPGAWTVTATGKNAAGTAIVQASQTVAVMAGQIATATLNCVPISGNGTLSLNLSWPSGAMITTPAVLASLTPLRGGTAQNLDFNVSATSASWTNSAVANGYYILQIQLQDDSGSTTLWGHADEVLILSGQITTGSWTLSSSDLAIVNGGISVAIGSTSNPPITITLSGNSSLLVSPSTMTVTASASITPDGWQWYLNGNPIPNATSASVTVGTALAAGPYWLDVLAYKGDGAGSSGCQFHVISSLVVNQANFNPGLVSDADIAKAATLKVYFEHASVGRNICDGLETLASLDPRFSSGRVSWSNSVDPTWYDTHSGLGDNDRGNPGASAKISGFTSSIVASSGLLPSKIDVAMYKFCYIDTPSSGAALFNSARAASESLQAAYPRVVFVWWTMPIETSAAAERQVYNNAVRQYCADNHQWLLDIADLESHDDSGNAIVDGNGRELLYGGYTQDGGHLPDNPYSSPVKNSPGSLKIAKAYWRLLAEIGKTR